MADKQATADENLDEDGLVIQKYEHMVLVVVPSEGYSEETLRYARSALLGVHVGTRTVSNEADETIMGRLQDEFLADGPLEGESMDDYAGLILVDGGPDSAMLSDPAVLALAKAAHSQQKLLAAWGHSVKVLAAVRAVNARRVTGADAVKADVKRGGGKFTGTEWERDGHIVTARDDSAGFRLGKAMVQVIALP